MQIRISKKNKWENPWKYEIQLLETTLKNEISIIIHEENVIRTPSLEENNTLYIHNVQRP